MIKQKQQNNGIEIDLTGPQGNAYFLMEMMSGDYENLVKVFDNNFGSVVTLYR